MLMEKIIATYLKKHFKILQDFKRKIESYDKKKQDDNGHFLAAIDHACDISYSAFPFEHFKTCGVGNI